MHTLTRMGAAALAVGVLAGGVVIAAPNSWADVGATTATPTAILSKLASAKPAAFKAATHNGTMASVIRSTRSTLAASRSVARPGQTVKLTGRVTYGVKKTVVSTQDADLQVRAGNTWKAIATQRISSDGYVIFTVKPTKSTTYRLAYAGAMPLGASVSTAQTVTVKSTSTQARSSSTLAGSSSTQAGSSSTQAGTWSSASASGTGAAVVAAAAAQSGKPYSYGAGGPNAFDCSGLTQYVFRQFGVSLPHNANAQKSSGRAVSRAEALPGDLIIFLSGSHGYHAGIYAGGGHMYDSPRSGQTVGRHQIWSSNIIFRRLV